MAENSLDSRLCQYMLCNHGALPSETIRIPFREKIIMWELIMKEMKEVKEHGRH